MCCSARTASGTISRGQCDHPLAGPVVDLEGVNLDRCLPGGVQDGRAPVAAQQEAVRFRAEINLRQVHAGEIGADHDVIGKTIHVDAGLPGLPGERRAQVELQHLAGDEPELALEQPQVNGMDMLHGTGARNAGKPARPRRPAGIRDGVRSS